ncbi:helix-turn-helix transcriptional regulator [Streptomyces sp. NPDC058459]|uniref:helix-turn-helix transcriptional regulator n=1 Tax=Streptomyces sp. NPDC058459 TaxID=3346508 RepID=UPI00364C0CBC
METEDLLKVSAVRRLVASGKLRERREILHLSAREMAAAISVSPAAVCFWESGRNMPRPAAALRLAKILDIKPDLLEAA